MRVLLFLLFSVGAWAQATFPFPGAASVSAGPTQTVVCHNSAANATGGSASVTTGSTNCTGATNCYVAVSGYAQKMTTTVTITSSPSNTWTAVTDAAAAQSADVGLFYARNASVSGTMTVTASGGSYSPVAFVCTSGGLTTGGADQSSYSGSIGGGCATGTTCQAGSITPSTNGQFIVFAWSSDGSTASSVNGGFTMIENPAFSSGFSVGLGLSYLAQVSAAAVNPTGTSGGSFDNGAAIASFK